MCSGDGKKCRTSSRGKTPNPSVSAMMMVPMPIPITEMGSTPMRTMNISAIDEMRSGTVATAPIIVSVNKMKICTVSIQAATAAATAPGKIHIMIWVAGWSWTRRNLARA
eukprot:scaffold12136_cov44-Cyclotella_meneghiniana.AAC.4